MINQAINNLGYGMLFKPRVENWYWSNTKLFDMSDGTTVPNRGSNPDFEYYIRGVSVFSK